MTSTNQQNSRAFAGGRHHNQTRCSRLAGSAWRRSITDKISIPGHFGGNFSSDQNGTRDFFGFNKCKNDRCKVKCNNNRMLLPTNNFRSFVNGRSFVILTDADMDCESCTGADFMGGQGGQWLSQSYTRRVAPPYGFP